MALLELRYTCYFQPNLAGPSSKLLGFQEAVSDVHGVYKFPLRVYFKPPLSLVTDKFVKYFRTGYFQGGAPPRRSDQSDLYRMSHYLNHLLYRDLDRKHHIVVHKVRDLREIWKMIAYEFYLRDGTGKEHLIGILPERRKKRERITNDSIFRWGWNIVDGHPLENIYFVRVVL